MKKVVINIVNNSGSEGHRIMEVDIHPSSTFSVEMPIKRAHQFVAQASKHEHLTLSIEGEVHEDHADNALSKLQAELDKANQQNKTLSEQLAEAHAVKEELAHSQEEVTRLQALIEESTAANTVLSEANDKLSEELASVKKALDEAQKAASDKKPKKAPAKKADTAKEGDK